MDEGADVILVISRPVVCVTLNVLQVFHHVAERSKWLMIMYFLSLCSNNLSCQRLGSSKMGEGDLRWYLLFCLFILCVFVSYVFVFFVVIFCLCQWLSRWETDFVLLYFATSYLAASDWAIARWEAGDLSCARTEEGFVIRVTNEAGQPSSLFHCCYNRYHHNLNWYDKWCFVTVRVVCTYILGSAMLQVERTPCQGRGWTYNHPQRSDQDRVPWNR